MVKKSDIKRLCSEIQLFDLCSREICKFKNGRFCTDSDLLAKFEAINEEDVLRDQFIDDSDEPDASDDGDEIGYDNGCFDDFEDEDENGDD